MPEKEMILSVLILTFNQEKYLRKALNSILSQKHNYRYEIVIGDDCSFDVTQRVIREYKKKYPDIIVPVFNDKNLGVIKNYYNAITYCKGEYIMECGGDDWWLPQRVEKQLAYMKANPSVGMTCGYAKVYNQELGKIEKKRMGSTAVKFEDLLINNEVASVTACYRKSVFLQYLKMIEPQKKDWMAEDYPCWLWFAKNSKIHFMNSELAVYRLLPGSISHPQKLRKRLDFEKNMYQIALFYSNDKTKEKIRDNYFAQIAYICYAYGNLKTYNSIIDHWNNNSIPLKFRIVYVINMIPGISFVVWKLFRKKVGAV